MSRFVAVLSGDRKPLHEFEQVKLMGMQKVIEWEEDGSITATIEVAFGISLKEMVAFFDDVMERYGKKGFKLNVDIEEVTE